MKLNSEVMEISMHAAGWRSYNNRFSLSVDNEYIPLQCILHGNQREGYIEYGLPSSIKDFDSARVRSGLLIEALSMSNLNGVRLLEWTGFNYYGCYGTLLCLDTESLELFPLMLLCAKQRYLPDILGKDHVSDEWVTLLIEHRFTKEPHDKVYKSISKNYISTLLGNIEVNIVPSLDKLCFKSSLLQPEFRTVTEMVSHYSNINSVLKRSCEDTLLGIETQAVEQIVAGGRQFTVRDPIITGTPGPSSGSTESARSEWERVFNTPESSFIREASTRAEGILNELERAFIGDLEPERELELGRGVSELQRTDVIEVEAEEEDPLIQEMRDIESGFELIDDTGDIELIIDDEEGLIRGEGEP